VNVQVVPPVSESAAGVVPPPLPVHVPSVTVPEFPPSEIVMVFGSLAQSEAAFVIVKLVEATCTYPLDGPETE
jgi:hypothetical protein